MRRIQGEHNETGIRLQAYRFALIVKPDQMSLLAQFAGATRYVYNHALALQEEFYSLTQTHIGYADLCALLTEWKKDKGLAWLKEMPSQVLQQALKNLENGWSRYFDGLAEKPVFKKKGGTDSFRYPQGFELDQANNRISLPKLGWVRYRNSRKVEGTVKNVTVSRKAGKWFISIQTAREVGMPVHPSQSSVGGDVGVVRFLTLSDGTVYSPLNSFRQLEKRLAIAQRAMAGKKKFSNNWKKSRARVRKVNVEIANTRRNFPHKISHSISKNHAMVVVEDLRIGNMSASAKGTLESPGTNVRQRAGLNKSILDQAWGELFRQLGYKLDWMGGRLVSVPPAHTSQTCPLCGNLAKENRLTQARFKCVKCGFEENADLVAANNILQKGLAACNDEGMDASTLRGSGAWFCQCSATPGLPVMYAGTN